MYNVKLILPLKPKTFVKIFSLGNSTYSNACRGSAEKIIEIMQSTVQKGYFPDADNRSTQAYAVPKIDTRCR